ncbi:unnamed protein product, partial [Staurois parvus]
YTHTYIHTHTQNIYIYQGRTDKSWGPRAIGKHGAPVSSPTLKPHPKKPMKKVPGASHGAPYRPWAVPKFPNGQSTPDLSIHVLHTHIHTHIHTHTHKLEKEEDERRRPVTPWDHIKDT